MATLSTTEHVWTNAETYRALDAGLLWHGDHLELIAGELIYKLDYCPEAAAFYQQVGMPLRRQWTRDEERELVRLGILKPGETVDLAEGDVLPAMSQKPPHPTTIGVCGEVLGRHFFQGCHVREEKAILLPDGSEPEPDVVVVPGARRDYLNQHPTTIWLLIEVASSSLEFDRKEKASLYARAGIQDYWIVHLVDHQLEVRRAPVPLATEVYDHGYQTLTIVQANGVVAPLVRPDLHIAVADLLP